MIKSYLKYISLAVFLSAIVACAEFGSIDTASDNGVWNVTASLSMSVDSKISETGNSLFWQEGDRVAFKAVSGNVESEQAILTLNRIDSGLPEAKFKGSVTMTNAPEKCWFAYPSDAVIAKDGSVTFDFSVQDGTTHAPYLYGGADYSEDGIEAVLKHAAAMIRLTVPEGVTKVEVSANSLNQDVVNDLATQKISKVTVAQDGSMSVLDDALDKITVTVQPASVNYVFVPAMNFIDGFSFMMTTADGEMMVKSYSIDGGNYSDYPFEAGSVIDIDLSGDSKPENISISCELEPVEAHDIVNGIITGTTIRLKSYSVTGVPDKVIDAWGVAVYDGEPEKGGTVVRFHYGTGAFNSNYVGSPMLVQSDMPLLLPKTYNVYAICQINGKYHYQPAGTLEIPELPEFTLSLSAETSYTVYKSQGATAANGYDGNSICNVKATTNIHQDLLNNANYGLSLIVKTDKHSETLVSTSGAGSNSYSLGNWGGHDPQNYTLYGSLIFAGKSTTASVNDLHVTGLPYKGNPPSSADWKVANGNYTFGSEYLQIGNDDGADVASKITATLTKPFYLPQQVDLKLDIKAKVFAKRVLFMFFNHDYVVYLNNSSIISQNSDDQTSGKDYTWSKEISISESPSIKIEGGRNSAGLKSYTYYVNLLYR